MTTSAQPRREADPWWHDEPAPAPVAAPTAPARVPRTRRGRRARPWYVRAALLPFVLVGRLVQRSPRIRRALLRLLVLGVIVTIVGGSVGVILLNNVVVRRSAELGKLDAERRELRRKNALLGAQAANQSSQAQVVRRAERLGMVRSGTPPTYTYLDPASIGLTPFQRQLRARRLAARAAQTERTQQSSAPAAQGADTPARGER